MQGHFTNGLYAFPPSSLHVLHDCLSAYSSTLFDFVVNSISCDAIELHCSYSDFHLWPDRLGYQAVKIVTSVFSLVKFIVQIKLRLIWVQCVVKEKFTAFHFIFLQQNTLDHFNWSIQIFGVCPLLYQIVDTNIIFILLMHFVDTLGYFCYTVNLKHYKLLSILKVKLKMSSIVKSSAYIRIGGRSDFLCSFSCQTWHISSFILSNDSPTKWGFKMKTSSLN